MCKIEKEITCFHKNKTKKDGLNTICKSCRKEYHKNWYKNGNRKYVVDKNTERKNKNREWVYKYLLKNPCIDCGEKDPIVLEFDHKRDKEFNISKGITTYGLSKIKKEIEKCEVVCSNCHKRRTAVTQDWFKFSKALK